MQRVEQTVSSEFWSYIDCTIDSFIEIEHRILLKFNSRQKTIEMLKERLQKQDVDEKGQRQALFEAWKDLERNWQQIAIKMDQVKELETEIRWQKDKDSIKLDYDNEKVELQEKVDQIIQKAIKKKKKIELDEIVKKVEIKAMSTKVESTVR